MKSKLFSISFIIIALVIICVGMASQNKDADALSVTYLGIIKENVPLALKNPSEYCLEDGFLYKSTKFSLGQTFLQTPDETKLQGLKDQVVMAKGKLQQDLTNIITKIGECPQNYGQQQLNMQIRSDWVGEETGYNIGHSTHEKLRKVSYIQADSMSKYEGFTIKDSNDQIDITFKNLFDTALENIQITVHYEKMYAMPQPHEFNKSFDKIEPGKTINYKFPKILNLPQDGKYEYWYFSITGNGKNIVISIQKQH